MFSLTRLIVLMTLYTHNDRIMAVLLGFGGLVLKADETYYIVILQQPKHRLVQCLKCQVIDYLKIHRIVQQCSIKLIGHMYEVATGAVATGQK